VVDDRLLHPFGGQIRQVAHAALATPSQEIPVPLAGASFCLGVDEA
jgi:hypothetical protein